MFSNELEKIPTDIPAGAIADLYTAKKTYVGRGFFNPNSLIAFRCLTTEREELTDSFFESRLADALLLRESLYPNTRAYRWVHGESDRLPGLVVDRFGDYLSVQAVSAGMDCLKDRLVALLVSLSQAKGVVWRTDSSLRLMEKLPQEKPEIVTGNLPEDVLIENENGRFRVDLIGGQKTGFYFDQRDNRQVFASLCKGKKVLDAYCYSGGFGIAAARAGAREVVFNDSSETALGLAEENVQLNGLTLPTAFVEGDSEKLLERVPPGGAFEAISIDPPAFAKSKKHLPMALKAYERLNALAMTAVAKNGLLATSSCSHHVTRDLFLEVLRRAARKARRHVRLLDLRSQAKDHPVLLAMPETDYLKCAILRVS